MVWCSLLLLADQNWLEDLTHQSNVSRVAQWKRAGPITQRSVDRNYALLEKSFVFFHLIFLPPLHFLHVKEYHACVHCIQQDPLAQRIARWTSNPKVLGSIPRWVGNHFSMLQDVRMAEWSKAPDSRNTPCSAIQSKPMRLLVLDEGMGSNPISDKLILTKFKEVSPTKRWICLKLFVCTW